MSVYIRLFHGRKDPEEELQDWGLNGPILGPFDWVHLVYFGIRAGTKKDDMREFKEVDGMILYDGIYYGDCSIFSEGAPDLKDSVVESYDPVKAGMSHG